MNDVLLEMRGITKTFPGVKALEDVSLSVRRGEIHAICGENGAGKSTLMKVLSGQFAPDGGHIVYKGRECRFTSALQAQRAGIAMIHQELNLVPHLSVAENIWLGREPRRAGFIDRARLHQEAARCLARLGVSLPTHAPVGTLPVAQQQMVEIAKALSLDAEVLVMDEPTSSLTEAETRQLFKVIRELKQAGVGIVYISHRLDEMAQIVDRVTVLRDGRRISTDDLAATTVEAIVSRMVGRALGEQFPPRRPRQETGDIVFAARGLLRRGVFGPLDFELRRGEILGFAGLMGAGRTEAARAVFGADPLDAGELQLAGRPIHVRSPRDAIAHGIAYLSEDRKAHGLAVKMPVAHNITLARMDAVAGRGGWIRFHDEARIARHYIETLGIRTPHTHQVARLLSGGNQQKVVIAKWLLRDSRVIFFDEPTRGIDVGAKQAIYQLLHDLVAQGIGVVLISSELPEILGLTDRVAVFHEGRISAVLDTLSTTQEEIMHFASGRTSAAQQALPH
jgi:ribose transport system ATP-binding protein